MEPLGCKRGISSPGSSQPPRAPVLKNFTIPRKTRGDGKALVEPCPKESRDYSFIQKTLSESRLDTSRDLRATWQCDHVKLIHNKELLTHFSEKRSELRSKERHARELEERFCFLVTSPQKASQIYQHGLTVQYTTRPCLGKASHGVCLYRHADVALKSASGGAPDGEILIVFKVLLGKVKKVVPVFGGSSQDPTVNYDCHVAKESANPRESLSQQVTGSSVFLFDYNKKQELNIRPRQCLPYAAVSFIPSKEATLSVLATIPSPKPRPMELKDSTKTCTMAERHGWGQNAKHVGTQDIPTPGHASETPTFQRSEQTITHCGTSASEKEPNQSNQNEVYQVQAPSDSRIPRQIPPFNIPLTRGGSKPFIEGCNNAGPVHPHIPQMSGATQKDLNTQQSSRHFRNIPNLLSVKENNQQQPMTALPMTGITEKVSSVVYCSRVIKDPRIHRHSSSNTSFDSEGNQKDSNTSRHESVEKPELKTVTGGSNEENMVGGKTKDKQSDPLANTAYGTALKRVLKKQPPYQMLKMKFRKYAAYLRLSKQKRKEKIQSLQNFSSDQKCMLSERINFYDIYFQKYKKGELVRNESTTVDPAVSCKAGSEHISTRDEAQRDTIQSPVEVSCLNMQASVFSSHNDIHCHQNSNVSPKVSHHETLFHNCLRVQGNPSSPLEQNSENSELKDTQDTNQRDQCPVTLHFTGRHGHLSKDVMKSRLEKQDCNFDQLHGDQKLCTRFPGESEDSLHSEHHDTAKIQIQETVQNVTSRDGRTFCEQSLSVIMAQVHTDSISQQLPCGSGEHLGNNKVTHEKIQTVSPTVNSESDQQSTNQSELALLMAEHPMDMIPEGNMGLEETGTEVMVAGNTTFQDDIVVHHGGNTKVIDMELDSDTEKNEDSISGSCIATGNEMLLDSVCSMIVHGSTVDAIGACEEVHAMQTSENTDSTVGSLVLLSRGQKREKECNTTNQPQEVDPKTLDSMVTKSDHSQIKDAIYIALCSRLQLSHLCPSNNENKLNLVSGKHYFKPTDINRPMDSGAPLPPSSSSTQIIKDKHHLFPVTIRADGDYSSVTEFPSLSKRFAVFGSFQETYNALHKEKKYKMANSLIKVLHSTTTFNDGLHTKNSTNAKFIKMLAEKYDKENSSFHKLTRKPQMSPEAEHSISKTAHPEGTRTSNKTKTRHIEIPKKYSNLITKNRNMINIPTSENRRRGTTNRRSTRDKNASNNLKSASSVHRISKMDSSRVGKTVSMKPRKCLMRMMKGFRRSNSWWTFSHRFNSNGMQCQGKQSNGPARSTIQEEMLSETKELLGCGHSKIEELKLNNSNHSFESNESPINLSKHKDDLSPETTKQADKHSHEEVKDNGGPVTRTIAGESVSASEIMEYPLDTAIEIICGSGVECGSTVSLPYSADYDVIETERSVISEGSGPSIPLEADDKTSISSKELKLISRLRDFLCETTVKTDKAMDLHAETTGEDEFHINQEAHGMEQQSVELVVLDRAELPSMRQPVCNPMMKSYDKELVIPKLLEQQVGDESKEVNISNINLSKVENSEVSTTDKEDEKTSGNPNNRDSISCISPDSTSMLVTPTVSLSKIILDKSKTDVYCSEISTSVPDWATTTVENSKTSGSRAKPISNDQIGQLDITEIPKPSDLSQKQDTSSFHKTFTVADISKILKEGDQADSMVQLSALRTVCKVMLHHFISNFERRQNVQANKVVATRDLILERYLELCPIPIDLKYEALNSFLDLQMMLEAWQFIDNKMRYISGHATFRSLLWYDPSLYGELFKGKVGFQQQSSLYTSFQQILTHKGTSALQRYHSAVCMLHQQLQKNHELSYYMYLKSKRERLEVEAVLRKPAEVASFFLSVPLSCMINLGDSVESLQRTLSLVSTFTETPADRLEGVFDIGKAENLAMMCRFLQEKISYLKTYEDSVLSKISWFGMEHLLYDASKILVWRDSRKLSGQALTVDFQTENPQIVYGKTEAGVSLLHSGLQKRSSAKISSHKRVHPPIGWTMPTEKKQCVQNQPSEHGPVIDLTRERTSAGPAVSLSKGRSGVYPFARPPNNIAPNHQPIVRWIDLSKSQSADHVDKSLGVGELNKDHLEPPPPYPEAPPFPEIRSCLMAKEGTKAQNRLPTVRESEGQPHFQQQWPPNNTTGFSLRLPPTPWSDPVRDKGLSSRKQSLPTFPPLPPFLQQPPLISLLGNPSQQPLCSLQRTANKLLPLPDPIRPNHPFFLNGQIYSTMRPALPTTSHAGRRFHPYPT